MGAGNDPGRGATLQIEGTDAAGSGAVAGAALWGRGFRPFFLGVGVYAAAVVVAWTLMWLGPLPMPYWLPGPWWHGHEMIFGVVAAAIAGFLLTSAPVWTGRPALSGRPLAALFALWVAGRAAMLAAGPLPAPVVAAVDGAFLPLVALSLARTVWGTGQVRNYGVVGLVAVLALANGAVHAQALGLGSELAPRALRFAVDLVVVLIVVIGGRITPPFTVNALLRRGVRVQVRPWPALDRAAVAAVVALAAADLLVPRSLASGALAAAAALAVGLRMARWHGLRSLGDPLVASLHAGMAWVVVGLGLVAAGDLGAPVAPTAGLHALTAGAMGAMILAVMTRVGLGHTGRPLVLPRGAVACYGLVHVGAAARVASALWPAQQAALLLAAGLLWAGAFALYAALYAPILFRPRVDGKPG